MKKLLLLIAFAAMTSGLSSCSKPSKAGTFKAEIEIAEGKPHHGTIKVDERGLVLSATLGNGEVIGIRNALLEEYDGGGIAAYGEEEHGEDVFIQVVE